MLTPTQTEVVNHLTAIFPNHSREVIEKTILHLDNLKEALDEGLLLQRGIDLLLDRNIAEQFGSAVPQDVYARDLQQPEDVVLSRTTDMQITDTPIFFPATPPPVGPVTTTIKEESVIKEPAQVVVQRQVSVASDSDSGDVILTRTEPGDVIFTGSENTKDVMITGETSSVNSNNGFGLQDIINKAVKDLDVPRADGTDGNNITAKLDKLSLPVSGPGVAAQSLLVSSRSTTPSLPSRTPSPWTDDDLPQVLPNLPKSLPDLPKRTLFDDDDLPEISWPSRKSVSSDNANNNSKSALDMNNLFFKEEKIASFKQGSKDDLPGVLPPGGNVTMPNSSNISGSILHKDKSSEDSKVDTGKPVVTGKPVDTSKQLDTGKQVDTGKHNVIETNKLTIQRTGSSYVVKNKTPADAFPGAGTNIIPEKSDVLSAGSKQTIDTHGASNALGASNAVHGIPGSTGDYQVVRKKTYQESVKKHASILGNDFSPKTNKSSTTPYKKDLTRKALAQRESESPKAVKMNKQKTTTDILSEARAVVDTVRTGVDRLVGRHNSGGACSSNSAVKKHSTPYKVDLTRKTIAQRESSASSSHTKVTMYNTSASNTPGKHVYTKSETMSFSQADEKTPVKHKIKSHASLPVSSTQKTFNQASLNSSHGTFSQSEVHHHANLPNKPAPNAGNIHTRVTMYETPTKTTPNVDVLRRLNTDPLPATQAQTNRQPVHATNPAPATVRAMTPPTQAPVVSKPATVTIQSQHVITYSDNVAKPTVVIPQEQTVVIPHEPTMVMPHEPTMVMQHEPTMVLQGPEVTVLDEPTMVLSGPEVTVHHRNDDARTAAPVEEPDVIVTLERNAEAQRQQVVIEVLALFPDVELNFLQDLALQHTGPYAVNNICNVLLEDQYPKAIAAPKATATATATIPNPEPDPDMSVDYYTDYTSEKLSWAEEDRYNSQVIFQLSQDFRWLPNATIRKVLGFFKNRYAPAFKELTKIWVEFVKAQPQDQHVRYSGKEVKGKIEIGTGTRELKFVLLKNRRPEHSPGPNRHPLLLKELAFISKKDADQLREADYKVAQELNEQMYEDAGQMIECGCCYGEYPFEGMIQCYEGHLFCQSCLHQYAKESVFGQGKVNLTCMTDECTSTFPKSQLVRALPSSVLDKYEDRMQEESLNLADLGDLVRCPHCDFAAIMDPGDKVFRCQKTTCMKETCRYCKEEWTEHFGKKCEEIEKKDETKLRLEYEEKMTRAKVRTCHRCKAEFCKEDGCNKMTCRCGAKMCYICRKPDINYDHFCRHPRDPGKICTACKDCSLWTNADEDDNRAVSEIQKAAEEARKQQGYTDEKLIGAPTEPPKKKQKTK